MMKAGLVAFLLLAPASESSRVVTREEMVEAMRACQGYDPTATTNGARFQAEVVLCLARKAREIHPEGPPLFLGHAEWFSAFLERTGLTAENAPTFVRLAYEHGQDLEIDYRSDRVIESAEGVRPAVAANVTIWWPQAPGAPSSYSYEDLLSTPHLKVTNKRLIAYRLLDLDGIVVYGEIEGLLGRPTSGFLGAVFQLIGEGHVKESRMLISPDWLQVSRARAEKWAFGVTQTVTVHPDGHMEKDVPPDSPDLAALAARLKEPLNIRYRSLSPLSR